MARRNRVRGAGSHCWSIASSSPRNCLQSRVSLSRTTTTASMPCVLPCARRIPGSLSSKVILTGSPFLPSPLGMRPIPLKSWIRQVCGWPCSPMICGSNVSTSRAPEPSSTSTSICMLTSRPGSRCTRAPRGRPSSTRLRTSSMSEARRMAEKPSSPFSRIQTSLGESASTK